MSARGFKLRSVVTWMAMVMLVASLPLGMVWRRYAYVNLSRGLEAAEKDRARLQNEVTLLETQVRALKQPSRLETLARDRLGLVDPGTPIVVQIEGQVFASAGTLDGRRDSVEAASWRGGAAWQTDGF